MVFEFEGKIPQVERSAFIAPNAMVSGDVVLEEASSVWFSAVLRGDIGPIRVGRGTNIQDGAVLHCDFDIPTMLGEYVTIGHLAVVHSCIVEDGCLIGMGATLYGGSRIGRGSLVGAGAVITPGKRFEERSLILGAPAKAIRTLSPQEVDEIRMNAEHYIELAHRTRGAFSATEEHS